MMYGADADELERLSSEFTRAADDLDRDGGLMTQLLNRVSWLGDVASRYVGEWTGVQIPRIGMSTEFLRAAAVDLATQAREQRAASTSVGHSQPWVGTRRAGPDDVATELGIVRAALDTGGWGVTAADLQRISATFRGMTPEERAAVFAQLTDGELQVLKDQMQEGRLKGGWSSEEQRDFLALVLPSISIDDARRLMGPDWVQIRAGDPRPFAAEASSDAFLGELTGRTGARDIAEDEIEIRALADGRYIVVLPGVVDLVDGLENAAAGGAAGLAGRSSAGMAMAALYDEWNGTNATGSARDMHYARQSEMNADNGSFNGTNGYAFAVKQAMVAAGVPAGAEVMLAGHSFGAYTAAELATDPSFNSLEGSGGYVRVSHVMGLGASAAFRMNELPSGTQGLLLNNANDAAYIGELVIPTNNADSAREVVFLGGSDGFGHEVSNYSVFAATSGHPTVDEFRSSAFERFGGSGEAVRVTVKDPYRVDH